MRPKNKIGLALLCVAAFNNVRPALARVYLSQKEALAIAFPKGQTTERRTGYLSKDEAKHAAALAKAPVDSLVWTHYVGKSKEKIAGYAYFETHVVRSMPETFMAVLDAKGRLRFVEILSFNEPDDYFPSKAWLKQFEGKNLADGLMVRRDLRNITGASLTSNALSEGVRRILAVHALLHPDTPTKFKQEEKK